MPPTGSDVGSLFPFIESQAVKGEFPLSFLRAGVPRPGGLEAAGAREAAGTAALRPAAVRPARRGRRARRRGRLRPREGASSTRRPTSASRRTCSSRRTLTGPAPAVVALHDHGGFYFWGKEKLVEVETSTRRSTEFKQRYYAGKSIASELARQGYVVIVIDMFYWGERRMLLDDDPADWRDRPGEHAGGARRRVQPARRPERAARRPDDLLRPASPGRA